ncbi:MAG: aminotransferase class I/II-fold pyridoxal phosphate-dependent enzyme [Xanthomonadales bacterium]|nr:aminotransferase class I/II-fold pyridoxal phosphate-dependent enzyme [Xanthomonadales bacterium]
MTEADHNPGGPGPLELSESEMTSLVNAAMVRITGLLATVADQPLDGSLEVSPEFIRGLREPLPESPEDPEALLDHLFQELVPRNLNPISPGFMGYIPGGGLFHAAAADLISNSVNRYLGVTSVSPALNQLERNVIQWFCQILGLPEGAGGFLTTGGSLANLSALVAARVARFGDDDFSSGVIYLSDQAHNCVEKSARIAGFSTRAMRTLPSDGNFRLCPDKLRRAIQQDRETGLTPFLVTASAGTTNTGAVDPLEELADLARSENLWFHVDAAYGGFFCLTERGKRAMAGIERADSVALDPHKTLFLPYGTGALLVRAPDTLRRAHSSTADYLPAMQDDPDLLDFCELSPELTRPFRGLRVWLPMKMHGAGVFRHYLDEKLDLARLVEQAVDDNPALDLLAGAELSVVAFAVKDRGQSPDQRNDDSQRLLAAINREQKVKLTGTLLHGVFAIRVAIVVFRTHRDRIEVLLREIQRALGDTGLARPDQAAPTLDSG